MGLTELQLLTRLINHRRELESMEYSLYEQDYPFVYGGMIDIIMDVLGIEDNPPLEDSSDHDPNKPVMCLDYFDSIVNEAVYNEVGVNYAGTIIGTEVPAEDIASFLISGRDECVNEFNKQRST